MFEEFQEWSIIIFDHVLILANDAEDASMKLGKSLTRCTEHNVFLKHSKSWFGFSRVKYFGYRVSYGKNEIGEECKSAIKACQMPKTVKKMQSFQGAALFFKSFVANFSDLSGPVYSMTKKIFRMEPEDSEEEFLNH